MCEAGVNVKVIQDALGHKEVTDKAVDPTYEGTGLTAGSHCDRCGEVIGVLDIDSPLLSRFDENDKQGLEAVARIIEEAVFQ